MPSARPTQHSIRVFTTLVLVVAAIALASLAVPATAQTYTVLHNYSAVGPRNFQYSAALVQGRDGNLYGTSSQGGTSALGTVFSISLLGADTTLHSFDGTTGTNTYGGVTQGSDGNFYGTTFSGGSSNLGVIYKITSAGTLTVLHNFTNTGDGGGPNSAPIQGSDGNFYGAVFGSGNAVGSGIFKITPTGVFKTLHSTNPGAGSNECSHHSAERDASCREESLAEAGKPNDPAATCFRRMRDSNFQFQLQLPNSLVLAESSEPLAHDSNACLNSEAQRMGRSTQSIFRADILLP